MGPQEARVGSPLMQETQKTQEMQEMQGIQGMQRRKLFLGLGLRVQQDESPRENQHPRS
jgi:hypothetical protein